MLACGAAGQELHVRPNAFGNALGESLAASSQSKVPAVTQVDANTYIDNRPSETKFPDLSGFYGGGSFGDGSVPPVDRSNDTLLAFTRKNGEYVDEGVANIIGKRTVVDAPAIPDALLPQGVDGRTVVSVNDEGGNTWYGMTLPGGEFKTYHSNMFFGGGQSDTPFRVEINGTGSDMSAEQQRAQWQQSNDDRITAGTYNQFSEIWNSATSGNWGKLWFDQTQYELSDAARAASNSRIYGPPPSPEMQRIDRMIASPIGGAASTITRLFGGSQRAQDIALDTGALGENFAGGMVGIRTPGRSGGSQGPLASRPRGIGDVPSAAEAASLQRIAARNRAGSPAADLRLAYQQARGQVDFAHIEADVAFKANGQVKAQGGHFSTSPLLQRIPGTETVSPNGVIYGQVNLLGSNGNFYLKTNNNGFATMTPDTWSLARAKGEMSQAFLNRSLDPNGKWSGTSSGVDFRFNPPNNNVPLWRGFPLP